MATKEFSDRYDLAAFAKLIGDRIGCEAIVVDHALSPEVDAMDGHVLHEQAQDYLDRVTKKHERVDRLLILTEAALEQNLEERVSSLFWPDEQNPTVVIASSLWLHMQKPPDMKLVNRFAPELPENPEFFNYTLGMTAMLCGAKTCSSEGCPTNPKWYHWDQRYYKSWLCNDCRTIMNGHNADKYDTATESSSSTSSKD
jgi:hypothetical protein